MKLVLSVLSGQSGGLKRGTEHAFDAVGGVIGRNGACDWRIDDATRTISGRHATVSSRDGRFYITDTSTNGVFVGESDEPLGRGRSAEIVQGTRLRFGDYVVVARLESDADPTSRLGPRMSIGSEPPPRAAVDPLAAIGAANDDPSDEPLSMVSERLRRPSVSAASGQAQSAPRKKGQDTLGSFFGSTPAPSSKSDPFADLGVNRSAGHRGGDRDPGMGQPVSGPVDTGAPYVDPLPDLPPSQPIPASPPTAITGRAGADLGTRLSDALATELGDLVGGAQTPQSPPIGGSPNAGAPSTRAAPASSPGNSGGQIPDHVSWEDLLGGGTSTGPAISPASPPVNPSPGGAPAQPLPPLDDVIGSGALSQPSAQSQPTAMPEPQVNVPPRARRSPGHNLLSDLVTPARSAGGETPTQGAALDPVSVLSQRASHRTSVPGAQARPAASAPSPALAEPASASAGGQAFDAFLAEAGLDPASIAPEKRAEVALELARMAKAAAHGLADVLAARRLFKEEFRLDQTRIQPEHNNPFKFYRSGEEALKRGAAAPEPGFLSLDAAMEEGFTELKAHEMAAVTVMQEAIGSILAQLDPASIQAEDAAGGFFGRGDGKALWERYRELHTSLSQDPEATTRRLVSDQFLRAYNKNLTALKGKDGTR